MTTFTLASYTTCLWGNTPYSYLLANRGIFFILQVDILWRHRRKTSLFYAVTSNDGWKVSPNRARE